MEISRERLLAEGNITDIAFVCQRTLDGGGVRHALVVADHGTGVELEQFVAKRCVVHEVRADIPRQCFGVHCLAVFLTCAIVERVVYQCVLRERAADTGHDGGEARLVEARVHAEEIVGKGRAQREVTDGLVHSIGVVAHGNHLCDSRLRHASAVADTRKLFLAELVAEVDRGCHIPRTDHSVSIEHAAVVGGGVGLCQDAAHTHRQVAFLRQPAVVHLQLLLVEEVAQRIAVGGVVGIFRIRRRPAILVFCRVPNGARKSGRNLQQVVSFVDRLYV